MLSTVWLGWVGLGCGGHSGVSRVAEPVEGARLELALVEGARGNDVEILAARLEALGVGGEVAEQGRGLVVELPRGVSVDATLEAVLPPLHLTLHRVLDVDAWQVGPAELDNLDLVRASVITEPEPFLVLDFTESGGQKLFALTSDWHAQRLDLRVDGRTVVAPMVMTPMREQAILGLRLGNAEVPYREVTQVVRAAGHPPLSGRWALGASVRSEAWFTGEGSATVVVGCDAAHPGDVDTVAARIGELGVRVMSRSGPPERVALGLERVGDVGELMHVVLAPARFAVHAVVAEGENEVSHCRDAPEDCRLLSVGPPVVTSDDVVGAHTILTDWGEAQVRFTLTPEARERFHALSAGQVGEQIALVFDGQAFSAPWVREAISGGTLSMGPPAWEVDPALFTETVAAWLRTGPLQGACSFIEVW